MILLANQLGGYTPRAIESQSEATTTGSVGADGESLGTRPKN
jgi:hypothetical protein